MSKITLYWLSDSLTHETQRVYRSVEPFDLAAMPAPIAEVAGTLRSYADETVTVGQTYNYIVSSYVAGGVELFSANLSIEAAASGSNGDLHWDSVAALLHLDGNAVNEVGGNWIKYGTPTFTTDSKFGGYAVTNASGNGGYYEDDLKYVIGTEPYTIECQWKITENNSSCLTFNATNVIYVWSGGLTFWNGSVNLIVTSGFSFGSYHHIALARDASGITRLFVDGELKGVANDAGAKPSGVVGLGNVYGTSNHLRGCVDEVRLTIGIARYTENFTPPVIPHTNYL